MLQGLVVAVVFLGGLVAVLSFGYRRLAERVEFALREAVFAKRAFGHLSESVDEMEDEVNHLKDVTDGMASQVVDEYLSKLSTNTPVVEPGIDTKVYGD